MIPAIFRQAEKADILLLVKARLDFLQALGHEVSPEEREPAENQVADFLSANLGHKIFAILAIVDGAFAAAGFLQVFEVMYHPGARSGRFGRVINMLTWPEYRGRGYARGIMERLLAQARELKLDHISLDASPEGRPLYESLGFEVQQPIHPPMTLDL